MSKPLKLLIGAATALPIISFGYLIVRFVHAFLGVIENGGNAAPGRLQDIFHELAGMQLFTLGLLIALLAFYLWHLLVKQARRRVATSVPLWVVALVVVPVIAMPVYWFVNIWPDGDARPGVAPRA